MLLCTCISSKESGQVQVPRAEVVARFEGAVVVRMQRRGQILDGPPTVVLITSHTIAVAINQPREGYQGGIVLLSLQVLKETTALTRCFVVRIGQAWLTLDAHRA